MPERLDATVMAMRVASEFFDGAVVNLGSGLPLRCCNYVPEEREVLFHTEQGLVGFGPIIYDAEKADPDLYQRQRPSGDSRSRHGADGPR